MTDGEVRALIRNVLRQEMMPAIMALMVSNETTTRSTVQRFSNESPRGNVRSIQPYGFASQAPAGTQAFVMQAGSDPTNQNILGHFDEGNKPALQDGDVALYDAFGNVFLISNGKFQLGSEQSSQNMVLGLQLQTMLETLLDAIAQHTHPGIGSPPSNASAFEQLKSSPVSDGKILSQKAFVE